MNHRVSPSSPPVFRDTIAVVIWAFTALWLCGVGAMVYLLWRDGVPDTEPRWLVYVLVPMFLLVAPLLARFACTQACTLVRVHADGVVEVTQRFPHRVLRGRFPQSQLAPAELLETRDSDGDPYFYCQLALGHPFPGPVTLAQGGRAHCVAAQSRFNAAIRQAGG